MLWFGFEWRYEMKVRELIKALLDESLDDEVSVLMRRHDDTVKIIGIVASNEQGSTYGYTVLLPNEPLATEYADGE
jgi:hypothetical protein